MGIELIHAAADFREIGEITEFDRLEASVSLEPNAGANDWMLELPEAVWRNRQIEPGHYLYIFGTEWGGPVERIRYNSSESTVRVYGTCWRGLLTRRIVCPPSGETHLVISGREANSAISTLLDGWKGGIFRASQTDSGMICSTEIRYRPLLAAIYDMLDDADGGLRLVFGSDGVKLEAHAVRDRSTEIELSQDYEAEMISDITVPVYNHILALGQGEMLDRTVIELWRLENGDITGDPQADGLPDAGEISTILYDYSSVESPAELEKAARKKLLESSGSGGMEISLSSADLSASELELTDRVSVRDTVTGMAGTMRVTGVELTISNNGAKFRYTLG